ncbi:L,D-transpeptidase family protein [Streptomyces scabiei]|uniref:L,D-transpeptidase family protein n=1 Tax=Streptomyces scabiei TaxID=1930 RepID=UPI00299042C3|nr:L,D-transpeptidase family protein [Streptomyces scabiei]MDW8810179.1 L,D-transpeptidase family protein [Streptomyces scabiei]
MTTRRRTRKTRIRTVAAATSALLGWTAVPAAAAAPAPECVTRTGPYQWDLERHLGLPADGRQSPADCVAIRAFQQRTGVRPADGYAGLATYRTMLVVQARPDPNAAGKCPVRTYQVTCVDLDRQLMWVQEDERVIYAPVPVRTGRDGQETRTGWHTVYWKNRDHHSDLYDNAPMPFAQFFNNGQAFHGVLDDLFRGGSHGCVNLRYADAERLWNIMHEDDAVYVWGVKPGTGRSLPPSADRAEQDVEQGVEQG